MAQVGEPIRIVELLSTLNTPAFLERVAVNSPMQIIKAKKAIKKAFQYQVEGRCYSLVEVLSTCCTNWGMSASESCDWLTKNMIPYYPIGDFKDPAQAAEG